MFVCEICNRELSYRNNSHIKKCEKLKLIKEEVINLYVNQHLSIRDLRKKFRIQSDDVSFLVGEKIRTVSEATILAHIKYPDNYKHSDETKKVLREKRLKYMKENPDKTSWRLSTISYPEKLFKDYITVKGLDKEYTINRELSVYPYFIDFAFLNEKVAVEIDGSQHLLPERIESDKRKDELLNKLGWLVIRISEKEIKTNIDDVFRQIISVLKEKPKVNNLKIGWVTNPKKYHKKERDGYGVTKDQYCGFMKNRVVNRPPYDILLSEINTLGYVGTGRKYGVSDKSIRKWVKFYEKFK